MIRVINSLTPGYKVIICWDKMGIPITHIFLSIVKPLDAISRLIIFLQSPSYSLLPEGLEIRSDDTGMQLTMANANILLIFLVSLFSNCIWNFCSQIKFQILLFFFFCVQLLFSQIHFNFMYSILKSPYIGLCTAVCTVPWVRTEKWTHKDTSEPCRKIHSQ